MCIFRQEIGSCKINNLSFFQNRIGYRLNNRKVYIFFLVVLFFFNSVFAGTTGKLSGSVTNKETGEPLIGANVMVEGTVLGAATDIEGNYFILQVYMAVLTLSLV